MTCWKHPDLVSCILTFCPKLCQKRPQLYTYMLGFAGGWWTQGVKCQPPRPQPTLQTFRTDPSAVELQSPVVVSRCQQLLAVRVPRSGRDIPSTGSASAPTALQTDTQNSGYLPESHNSSRARLEAMASRITAGFWRRLTEACRATDVAICCFF